MTPCWDGINDPKRCPVRPLRTWPDRREEDGEGERETDREKDETEAEDTQWMLLEK